MLRDNSLKGLVVGMERDLLSFEDADIAELAANFQEVIEDYLAMSWQRPNRMKLSNERSPYGVAKFRRSRSRSITRW